MSISEKSINLSSGSENSGAESINIRPQHSFSSPSSCVSISLGIQLGSADNLVELTSGSGRKFKTDWLKLIGQSSIIKSSLKLKIKHGLAGSPLSEYWK